MHLLAVPHLAPTLGQIIRTSASEIEVQWNALPSEEGLEVDTYLVKYRQVHTVQRRDTEDLSIILETNQTSYVISGLDPGLSYAVSVAASNRGGAGNFSQEVVVGCKSSSTE